MTGNDCLLGQVATFVDNLHLSYREVVYEIPYRNLVLMQRDKLRASYGERVEHVTGSELAARRNQTNKD